MRVLSLFFPQKIEPLLQARLAEACLRFTPLVAVRGEEAIFLEISKCHRLYSEKSLIARIQVLLKRALIVDARYAFANDAATALCLARFQKARIAEIPIEGLPEFLSPFFEDEEARKVAESITPPFHKLGLQQFGDLARIPPRSLASRFSKKGALWVARLKLALQSGVNDAWPSFVPPEVIEEKVDLFECDTLDACNDIEILAFSLKPLLDRLAARLHARGLRVSTLELSLGLSRDAQGRKHLHQRKILCAFPLPQSGAKALLKILRERLAQEMQNDPFESAISQLHLKILETAPGLGAQRNFFHRKEEEQEELSSLISRLTQKIGKDSVFFAQEVACHRPETTWRRVLIDHPRKEKVDMIPQGLTRKIRFTSPDRPSRLLKKPVQLSMVGDWLIAPEERRWEALEWVGPERLVGEWWQDPLSRNYYRVTSVSGERLWVFRDQEDRFFLHGYFD